jgi:DNA-3-methyladenine glycosylase
VTPEDLRDLLARDVVAAAPALLGAMVAHGPMRAQIVETEAYRADDPACHAYRKTTMRNMVLFGPPGYAYVYLNYGMHWMLNLSAHADGDPAGVLIRAAMPLAGLETMRANRPNVKDLDLLSGPGKLCRAFGITRDQNGIDLLAPESPLRIEPGEPVPHILTGPRIGIAKGKGHETPWRFMDADRLEWVSRGK